MSGSSPWRDYGGIEDIHPAFPDPQKAADILPPRLPDPNPEPNDLKVRRSLCPRCGRAEIENASGFCNDCRREKKAAKKWLRNQQEGTGQ